MGLKRHQQIESGGSRTSGSSTRSTLIAPATTSRGPRSRTHLTNIPGIQPIYFLPNDNLAAEVLIPCLSAAETFDCMVGYFSSRSFAQLAPGLASFLANPDRTLRLIISPFLIQADREAIEKGLRDEQEIVADSVAALLVSEEGIVRHTFRCLSYLIARKRLSMKIVLMKAAQFHLKAWIVTAGDQRLAAHGSGNFTEAGLIKNYEQITVSCSWIDPNQDQIITSLQNKFAALWDSEEPACRVYDLPEAVKMQILRDYPVDRTPTEHEYLDLVREKGGFDKEDTWGYSATREEDHNNFAIPPYLTYREGEYSHQGNAVDAWCGNSYRGILEMATGSGKTITAMVAAKCLHEKNRPLLIVIAAPYLPLIDQWCEEVQAFGIAPENLANASGSTARRKLVSKAKRRLRHRRSDIEVLVATHDTLCDPTFIGSVADSDVPMLLIADEVHNLGRESFVADPPDCFRYRLGLSATPVRQYDPEGTALLTEYFGEIVFSFPLEQAIGVCLTPYDYFVHTVYLTEDETDRWLELTDKIKRMAAWGDDEDRSVYVDKLLRDRRVILESAHGKLDVLERLLCAADLRALHHTLIYATDKDPDQLDAVNALLRRKGLLFHQLTASETRDKKTMRKILKSFQSGALRILTAKRVLDEGVNVPEITTAYILASTTVERQWVQRRGRILRKCSTLDKPFATLHDFLVLPPTLSDIDDRDARTLVKQELRRVMEFATIARNAGKPDGAANTIHNVVKDYFGTGM